MTRKVVSPIALDKSINTTEHTPRNIADVLAQQLAAIKTAIESGNGNLEAAFVCYYGVTTATQIKEAIDDGKVPYFYYNGAVAQLWKVETDKYTFRTTNTRSVEGQTILDVVDYVVNGSVWSTITREVSGGSSSGQSYIASVNSLADFDTTGKSGMQDLISVANVPADGVYQVSVMLHITPKTASATKSDLVFHFTSGDGTGWPNHTFHAVVDDSQTFAQQLSFSTSVSLKAGQNTLRIQCGGLNTEYLVFVDELTLAQLVNGVYHNGDDFDEVHTLPEAADFNNDDGVLVDGATGGPRFMLWRTLANNVLGFIKSLSTTITDFRTGDAIPVDGPLGTAKMSKDDLLKETAENAVAGNVAPVFDSSASYKAGQSVVYRGRLYTFKNDHTGAWVANDATATSVNDTFGKPVNISGVNKDFSAGVDILQDKLYKSSLGFYTTNGLQSSLSHKYYEIDPSQVDTIYFELSVLNGVQIPHMVVLDSNGVYHGFGNTKTQQTYTFSASDCKDYIAGARIFVNAYTITTKLIVKCSDIHKAIEPTIDDIKTSISTLGTEVEGLQKTVYTSLSQTLTPSLSMLVNFPPALVDGHYHYVGNFSNLETPAWIYFGLQISESWKKGHDYFVAIDLEVVEDSRTAGGNFYADLIAKKAINQTVSTQQLTNTGVVNGTRGNLLGVIHITDAIDTYTGADNFIVQCGKYDNTGSLELNLYSALVFDMGVSGEEGYITYEDAEALFATYGYQNVVKVIENAYHATIAEMAKGVQNMDVSGDIDLWGDSLVAQGYGSIIGTLLDRTVYSHGFGGKNSGYIRDQFLAYQSKSNAIIINVGRNDAATNNADKVFQNISAMVASIPHQNYLICCPPNGNYAGEGDGGIIYQTFFERLEDRLAKAYGANFLNTREGTICSYDMGNVKLTEGFTKPAVGSSVTVKVSDAAFLTTYNAADVATFGQAEAAKVAIGHTIDAVDIYSVASYDNENNTLTLTLLTDGSDVAVGGTFDNVTTGGAVYYARVMQYLDYLCWKQDRTESTFRADGIHMSDAGKNCLAQVVARKVSAMKI